MPKKQASAEPAAVTQRPAAKRKRPATAADAATSPVQEDAPGLLGAGIQALKEVRDDMRARRSRVFAALLGLDARAAGSEPDESLEAMGVGHADAAGAKQAFEAVFDQRVAQSLQRLGYPSPDALAALILRLPPSAEPAPRERPARGKRSSRTPKAQP